MIPFAATQCSLFLLLQQLIESFNLGLAATGNHTLLVFLIFIADLCVDAARKNILLSRGPRLARLF